MAILTHIKKNKETISIFLSIINTTAIVAALIIGINEFVIKEEKSSASRLENSFLLINELNMRGPLKHDYTNYDFENFSIMDEIANDGQIVEDIDDILTIYQKISFCLDIGECDEDLVFEKACSVAILNDADILQKTIVQEIERGGVFIDRIRVFEFFDFIKMCLNRDLKGRPANHKIFLDTYKDEIDFIRNFP